jgi:hypothetical protein
MKLPVLEAPDPAFVSGSGGTEKSVPPFCFETLFTERAVPASLISQPIIHEKAPQ